MTDLNSQLNYSSNLHYQQQQQLQNHLHKLQSNIKTGGQDKIIQPNNGNNAGNSDNALLNIPLVQQQEHQTAQPQPQQVQQSQQIQSIPPHQGQIFNNNGLFTDTLSPFFAPYGIDVSHFPLTNPPIFESALMMNNQGQPRRRISISNGQIGQITTHTLNGDDLYDSQPPPLPKQTSQDDSHLGQNNINQQLYTPLGLDPISPHVQVPPQQHILPQSIPPQQQQEIPPRPQTQQPQAPPQQHVKREIPFPTQGASGIPSHKLVYNNQVIFNPDAGPIPGTAAWKKARLLERNRIAASKCRQRKKAAHIQLKEDVEKYQSQINQLKKDKRELFDFYLKVKGLYEGGDIAVGELGKFLGEVSIQSIDNDADEVDGDEDDDDVDDIDNDDNDF